MQPTAKTEVADWIRKADNDLQGADLVSAAGLHDLECFLHQQAAEKALKGLLVAAARPVPHVHDIGRLLSDARAAGFACAGLDDDADLLTPFAVVARYPGFGHVSPETARRAKQAAARIVDHVKELLDAQRPVPAER